MHLRLHLRGHISKLDFVICRSKSWQIWKPSIEELAPQAETNLSDAEHAGKKAGLSPSFKNCHSSQLKDISGLSAHHKQQLRALTPSSLLMAPNNMRSTTVYSNRKLFAKFGSSCGIDASVCWPTKAEFEDMLAQDELEEDPNRFLSNIMSHQQTQHSASRTRYNKIEENMQSMGRLIDEYSQRKKMKDVEATSRLEKRKLLLEEAEDVFGYAVDIKSEKVEKYLAEKDKLAKKLKREAKRKVQKERAEAQYSTNTTKEATGD